MELALGKILLVLETEEVEEEVEEELLELELVARLVEKRESAKYFWNHFDSYFY